MKVFITGINGFIGTHLSSSILRHTGWSISGFDIYTDNLKWIGESDRLTFRQGDIFNESDWVENQIREADIVIPLAGIAKPAFYIKKPVWTFELDFEQNLKAVRLCAKYNKRLIFPSTSEVYGMSSDEELSEDESFLVVGPIDKTRWIYSCSKQMMDRMIFAYGQEANLRFTIFRPFNWIGPRLDNFHDAESRRARSITQMIYDVINRQEITLVDGGRRKRSFTWIGDAIDGLMSILLNERDSKGRIFNIGNPHNNHSIRELAETIIAEMKILPRFAERASKTKITETPGDLYYGKTYQDMENRVPSVKKMKDHLNWQPTTTLKEAVAQTVSWYAENIDKLYHENTRTIDKNFHPWL